MNTASSSTPHSEMADLEVERTQKVYADVMLNMAKASAAQVAAAKQRASILVKDVATVKQDAVAALVRLKGIMKAKIKKVKSHHVKNINELQEQLHDAQNTVATLQVELQRANTELEQTRQTLAEERTKILPTSDKVDSDKTRGSRSKMHLQNKRVSLKNKTTADDICHAPTNAEENGAVEKSENLPRSGSDLSSFMTRNKKSELHCYGRSQRILAVQQRRRNADSSLEQSSKQASALNNCSRIGKNDTAGKPSIVEEILQSNFLANCKRKRGRRSRPSHMLVSSSEHMKSADKSSHTSAKDGCLLLLQAIEHDLATSNMLTGYSGEGLTNLKDDFAMGGKDANICTVSAALKDAHGLSNMQVARRKRSRTVRVFKDGCCESTKIQIAGEGKLLVDHPECKTLENISRVSKEVKMEEISNLASDRADPLIISSLDKEHNASASSGVSMQAAGPRCIKYTFNRRKRKGVLLDATPQGAVPEKSSSLVSLADKEEPQINPETQVLLEESSEDDGELISVAQQLLLLSKMRWRQFCSS